jgi:hypothetical protein
MIPRDAGACLTRAAELRRRAAEIQPGFAAIKPPVAAGSPGFKLRDAECSKRAFENAVTVREVVIAAARKDVCPLADSGCPTSSGIDGSCAPRGGIFFFFFGQPPWQ